MANKQQRFHLDHRLLGIAPRTVGILLWWKIGLPSRWVGILLWWKIGLPSR
jgi:hypothetical protein